MKGSPMKGSPILIYRSHGEEQEQEQVRSTARKRIERVGGEENNDRAERCGEEINEIADRFQSMTIHIADRFQSMHIAERVQSMTINKFNTSKRVNELSWEKYGLWRQDQKTRAARLEKQLKARWELEELIEEQLDRFHAHYNRTMVPTRLKDVAQLLMPKWAPPCELAALSWLGDWRPSAILGLLRGLAHSSSSLSSSLSDSTSIEPVLSQLIHDIRIEEAIIDEEMAEIQATCVLHLPFAPMNKQSGGAALECIQAEFKKIEQVITKAQQLRFRTLELVVKKVLNQTDAAEFLVAFAGVQDAIHHYAEHQRLRTGPVTVPVKALGSS